MWAFNPETKAKFAQKNVKKNGYVEGLEQIENTPEIAVVEWEEEVQPVLEPEKGKANRMRKSAVKESFVKKGKTSKASEKKGKEVKRSEKN